jgi:DNA-binding response OmpR family regulator
MNTDFQAPECRSRNKAAQVNISRMRLLIIEDDPDFGPALSDALRAKGHQPAWARSPVQAQAMLQAEVFDVLLLDLGLPDEDGFAYLTRLRRAGYTEPVIILTARDAVDDRVQGLDAGADDYLIKPFSIDELTARLRAVQRRRQGRRQALLVHGALVLDPAAMRVTLDGQAVDLSRREFALLHALLAQAGQVLSRAELEETLYGWGQDVESNAIEVHIHHLRRKLGTELIRTVRGVGYLIERPA